MWCIMSDCNNKWCVYNHTYLNFIMPGVLQHARERLARARRHTLPAPLARIDAALLQRLAAIRERHARDITHV